MTSPHRVAPPDQDQRERALDRLSSILVQAPAGSGKTDLLTRRFLRLMSEVEDPSHIVAITFTKAAAAEMRHRILAEIEKAESQVQPPAGDEFAMDELARRALRQSRARGWNLIDLPSQLRILTIDAFCRELAIQQPLLSELGGGLDIAEQPRELYRRAARRTLKELAPAERSRASAQLPQAIEDLLLWRDNSWQDIETQLVEMLAQRDRWMQGFVLESEQDWDALRERLERPFAQAVAEASEHLESLFAHVPGALDEVVALARFAWEQTHGELHQERAERADFPCGPFAAVEDLEEARLAWACAAKLLLTEKGLFRQSVKKQDGFPQGCSEKQRFAQLVSALGGVEDVEAALADAKKLPATRYTEEEWKIVRAAFLLLRRAAAELKVVFAESGKVDYVEVAQLAQIILEGPDEMPTDTALAVADGIHHLLVDEFQDTSRRQHRLIASLVAAWPDTAGRTVFVVGDPMQSIYFFRDADAELFPRVRDFGLDLPAGEPLRLNFVPLASNFRTTPQLVDQVNDMCAAVFRVRDRSGVSFARSRPVRSGSPGAATTFALHCEFVPQTVTTRGTSPEAKHEKDAAAREREAAQKAQTRQILSLIRRHVKRMDRARLRGEKYRVAVLGRTRPALAPIAQALRDAAIPFRAVDLEPLAERQEVLDVLALARAVLNTEDRVAWLGVLRAPWCGLSLRDLHLLAGADDPTCLRITIPELLRTRSHLLSLQGQRAVTRLTDAIAAGRTFRSSLPAASIGTWLKMAWKMLGGADCVTPAELVNVNLLWSCLDKLPGGEPDLLGRSLTAALANLTAQPDPDAASDCGVQLMTIHKSKGLEFEVVIVPEMQAPTRRTTSRLLTWLERGIDRRGESGEVTEFLIAPVQPKGHDSGKAKRWVDREYRQRETQEIRRILYVAATRAREELHFFARPSYKQAKTGERTLSRPRESLLLTAWPALQTQVELQFDTWKRAREAAELVSLAAAGDNVVQMALFAPSDAKPAILRRLPFDYQPPLARNLPERSRKDHAGADSQELYQRHEGGSASRALGSSVHAFFEELARLMTTKSADAARAALSLSSARIAAQIRATGVTRDQAGRIASEALEITRRASLDPAAAWILAPRKDASSETRWTGLIDGTLRIVQVDRVFSAGSVPSSEDEDTWWIVDYKTAHAPSVDPQKAALELRPLFAPQLEIYAQVLRHLHGTGARIHAGLYYPRMLHFDWWPIQD